jgi:hypothetical protein
MPRDVNPFEPWRPRRDDDPSQRGDDDFLRRWRPEEEPADPEPEPEWYRQPQAPTPAWLARERKPAIVPAGFVWLTFLLLLVALIVWAANGAGHASRVGSALLVVWLGVLLAWPAGRRRRWYTRLGFAGLGLAGMAACWLWVPTTGGVSLWQAEGVVEQTRRLAPDDVAGFQAGAAERAQVSREFPRIGNEIRLVERSWFGRLARQEIDQAERERTGNPAAAGERLRKLHSLLQGTEAYSSLYPQVQRARQQTLEARLARLSARLEELTRQGRYTAVIEEAHRAENELTVEAREVQRQTLLQSRLQNVRRKNLEAHAASALATLKRRLAEGRHAEVAVEGRRLEADLLPEARELGQEGKVGPPLRELRRKALVARRERAVADLNALLQKGDDVGVPARARQHEDELRAEAAAVGMERLGEAFRPARRKALERRVEKGRRTLEELLKKKDLAGVATRGEGLVRELEPEAIEAAADRAWREPLTAVRRKALSARLEQAQVQARALLAKDNYQALSEAGDKALRDLGLEAEAVGRSAEVLKFRDLCRFFARLAKEAKAE